MRWNRRAKWSLAAIGIVVYFSTALGLKHSYAPVVGPTPEAILLKRPFHRFKRPGVAFVAEVRQFDEIADTAGDADQSPILLYENDRPLGPPHSLHTSIAEQGRGLFSHWTGIGLIFSTRDNTDPNTNGRNYWIVRR